MKSCDRRDVNELDSFWDVIISDDHTLVGLRLIHYAIGYSASALLAWRCVSLSFSPNQIDYLITRLMARQLQVPTVTIVIPLHNSG